MKVSVSLAALAAALSGDHFDLLSEIAEQGSALPATSAPASAPVNGDAALADRMADFITNDNPSYTRRSVGNIAKGIGATDGEVERVARSMSDRFSIRNSTSGLGLLVEVRD